METMNSEAEPASAQLQESSETPQRRDRGVIAVQACETCRSRKSRCDERRPKCGLCRRLNIECFYREPIATKKDKTMGHILDALTRIEDKFDQLSLSGAPSTLENQTTGGPRTSVSYSSPSSANNGHIVQDLGSTHSSSQAEEGHRHLTVPHKIILWPSIYLHLVQTGIAAALDLPHILQEGTAWFIRLQMESHKATLPADVGLMKFTRPGTTTEVASQTRTAFTKLPVQRIEEYCDAYFNTFNALSPLLKRETFISGTISPIVRDGFAEGQVQTVLALFVLALGQLAVEGIFERPISVNDGVASGLRGGTVERPPGLEIFNEARRCFGLVMSTVTIESVQCFLLQATYYEASARHLDFWQSTVSASMMCQVIIKCQAIDWKSSNGDLVKRAYWTCVLSEDLYHFDLDLPRSGIHLLEDLVPLPYFNETNSEVPGVLTNDANSISQFHFLAMIALRKSMSRIHGMIHESSSVQSETRNDFAAPPVTLMRELTRQLESWRSLLPRSLQWQDNDPLDFPTLDPATRRPIDTMFSVDQGPVPISHKYNLDIITAQIRTRFYHARFMIYRPFVYKALHFPELMTSEDRNYCGLALKAALLWPISLTPPKNKKRLVPHLFTWTQNFTGILLVLRMATVQRCLKSVCEEYVDQEDMQQAVALMLEWVRDVRQIDSIADWSWRVLQPLYSGDS